MNNKTALIIVDLQNDFCQGGALAVPDADAIVPLINTLQAQFDLVVATKDWHPANHASFASNQPGHAIGDRIMLHGMSQVLWPEHCIQETKGAEFHPELNITLIEHVVYKGTDPAIDSYSAFFDNGHFKATGLAAYLQQEEVSTIYVVGLATDYCVKYTCLDAVALGFDTHLIVDASRGVELKPGDIASALKEMQEEGVNVLQSQMFL